MSEPETVPETVEVVAVPETVEVVAVPETVETVAVPESGKVIPPKMPTPRFTNPRTDRLFRRAKLRFEDVSIEIEVTDEETGEVSQEIEEFRVHQMSAGMKARFEAIMQEGLEKLVDEGEILDDDDEEAGEKLTRRTDMGTFKLSIVAASATYKDDGSPVLTMEEVEAGKKFPAYIIEPLFEKSFILTGLGKAKKNEKKAEKD